MVENRTAWSAVDVDHPPASLGEDDRPVLAHLWTTLRFAGLVSSGGTALTGDGAELLASPGAAAEAAPRVVSAWVWALVSVPACWSRRTVPAALLGRTAAELLATAASGAVLRRRDARLLRARPEATAGERPVVEVVVVDLLDVLVRGGLLVEAAGRFVMPAPLAPAVELGLEQAELYDRALASRSRR